MIKTLNKQKLDRPLTKNEYAMKYYESHKEQRNDYQTQSVNCKICGCPIIRAHLSRHHKTAKCIKAKNNQTLEKFLNQNINQPIVQNDEQPVL